MIANPSTFDFSKFTPAQLELMQGGAPTTNPAPPAMTQTPAPTTSSIDPAIQPYLGYGLSEAQRLYQAGGFGSTGA